MEQDKIIMEKEINQEVTSIDQKVFSEKLNKIINDNEGGKCVYKFNITLDGLNALMELPVSKEFFSFSQDLYKYLERNNKSGLPFESIGYRAEAARKFILNHLVYIKYEYCENFKKVNTEAVVICEKAQEFLCVANVESFESFINTMRIFDDLHLKVMRFWSKDFISKSKGMWTTFLEQFSKSVVVKYTHSICYELLYNDGVVLLKPTVPKEGKTKEIVLKEDLLTKIFDLFNGIDNGINRYLLEIEKINDYTRVDKAIRSLRKLLDYLYKYLDKICNFSDSSKADDINGYICSNVCSVHWRFSIMLAKFIHIRYLYNLDTLNITNTLFACCRDLQDEIMGKLRNMESPSSVDSTSVRYPQLFTSMQKTYKFYSEVVSLMKELDKIVRHAPKTDKKSNKPVYSSEEFNSVIKLFKSRFKDIKSGLDCDNKNETESKAM